MYEAALVLSVVSLVGVAVAFWRSPAFSIFHPLTIYIAFHGLVFVFRPILAWKLDYGVVYRLYQFQPSPEEKLTTLLAANLGFLTFALFAYLAGNASMQFKNDRFVAIERERLKRSFLWMMAICVPIGAYSMASFWSAVNTGTAYSGMIRDPATGIFISTTGNGYMLEAQIMLASCSALLAWVYRFRLLALVPLASFIVLRAGSGGRGPFIAAFFMVVFLYLYDRRKKLPAVRTLLLAAPLLIAFNAISVDRGFSIREALGVQETQTKRMEDRSEFMEGMDFANLEYFEYIVHVVPDRSGTYDYFLNNLQIFTEPVPRVLWPSKPIGSPVKTVNLFQYGYPIGITLSLPGVGWYSYGWLGVMIWCGLWGFVLGWIYRRYVQGQQNALQTAAYMVFLPILIVAFRDGTILTVLRQGLFYLGPVVVWMAIARFERVPSAQGLRKSAFRRWQRNRKAQQASGGEGPPLHSPAESAAIRPLTRHARTERRHLPER